MQFLFSMDSEKEKMQTFGFATVTVALDFELYP